MPRAPSWERPAATRSVESVSASAERKRRGRTVVSVPKVNQSTCQRYGAARTPWAKAAQKPWAFGRIHLRLVTRLQTCKCADVLVPNLTNPSRELSERSTHLPGCAIKKPIAFVVKSMRNGSNTPHNADRSPRVGSGRPPGCPQRTPCGVRGRILLFCFRTGHLSAHHSPKPNSLDAGPAGF